MKIGILTYHKTTNYGALFQCYALQKYINNKGAKCEVINYNNKTLIERYNIDILKNKSIKDFLKKLINYKVRKSLIKSFENFSKKNINISEFAYNEKNIKNSNQYYDKFIVGSDQIWNLKLSGNDENYYLNFVNDKYKKNSYAASFGITDFSKSEKETILNNLKEFENISIREKQGLKLIDEIGIKKGVTQNIDPVFLLSKKEWETFTYDKKNNKEFILVYEITYTDDLIKFAKAMAKKNNLEIIFVSGTNRKIIGAKNRNNLSPEEFLTYIKNAKTIITSSFHGMALSIIFNKEFYYDIPNNKKSTSSRLDSLAELLGLQDRRICMENQTYKQINYKKINEIISKEKKKAEDYIDSIIT